MKKQKIKRKIPYKKILFLTAIHGDEKIGVEVMKRIEKMNISEKFDWFIANKKAFRKGVRFLDRDLNRSAPGSKNSKKYELSRAYELIELSKKYSYIIDIHGAAVNCGIFTIISNPKLENLFLASTMPVKKVVIWPAKEWKEFGPVTQFVDCGLEIECGPKNSKKIQEKLFKIITSIIKKGILFDLDTVREKDWYLVYGKIDRNKIGQKRLNNLKDFQKANLKGEGFYPLLTGQYQELACYKMEKINFFDKFSY